MKFGSGSRPRRRRGSVSTNNNEIKQLGQDAPIPNTGIGQLVGAYNVNGFPMGSFFYKKVVSATLTEPGKVADVMCEGGTSFGRGNGTTVPCAEAPLVFFGGAFATTGGLGSNGQFLAPFAIQPAFVDYASTPFITATAEDADGNTSEFSSCIQYVDDTVFSNGFD